MEAGTLVIPIWATVAITGLFVFGLVLTIKYRRGLFYDHWGITVPVIILWSTGLLGGLLGAVLAANNATGATLAADALMALIAYLAIYNGGDCVDWRDDLH